MVAQLSGVQWSQWQLEGFLVLDRLLVWLGVSLGGNVLGCVATLNLVLALLESL